MNFLLDDTSAGGIAKVVDTLYKKGVYDAVEEKNAPFTKAFVKLNNDYKRFQFLDNPNPISIISFKDRLLIEVINIVLTIIHNLPNLSDSVSLGRYSFLQHHNLLEA